jgi:tetratricopeptide (TPR) repeat protein
MPPAYFPYEMYKLLGIRLADPSPADATSLEVLDTRQVEAALRARGTAEAEIMEVVTSYKAMRESMRDYEDKKNKWDEEERGWGEWRRKNGRPGIPPPLPFDISVYETVLAKLPPEFALYAQGAAAYHMHTYDQALVFFGQVMDLPKEQKVHRSVWAVFMRGMTHLRLKHYGEALSSFDAVRSLVSEGFDDPLRLAAAAADWKGRVYYECGDFVSAIRTYLDTCETWDGKEQQAAFTSLKFAFAKLEPDKHSEQLKVLVSDERCKKAMVVWALANPGDSYKVRDWLLSELKPGAAPLPYADRLAWLAYESGGIEQAKRWCNLGDPDSLITQWVREKTSLHDGNMDEAVAGLNRILQTLEDKSSRETTVAPQWKTYRLLECDTFGFAPFDIKKQVQTELAIVSALQEPLALVRCKAALKALPMDDALGICKNMMTISNLQEYVTALCPMDAYSGLIEFKLREILVRRLIQEKKLKEAGDFCPQNPQNRLRRFLEAMKRVEYKSLPPRVRAENMIISADISRSEDLYGDDFYTEQMWQAASLLPNNDVLTAQALYYGGNLIRYRNPKAADKFYKALVRRNPTWPLPRQLSSGIGFPTLGTTRCYTHLIRTIRRPIPAGRRRLRVLR